MFNGGLGLLLEGIGGLLLGVMAVVSYVASQRARRDAREAREASAPGVMENLRVQVKTVVDAYEEAVRRHQYERATIEQSLQRERERADGAELVAMRMQGQVAEMRIDLASAKQDLADLRARFDASIAARSE